MARHAARLVAALLLIVGLFVGGAWAGETVRVGALKFGTLAWEMDVIRRHGLDKANGIDVEVVELASNESTKVAIQSQSVDVIVSDWLWVSRQRAEGAPLTFVPFSTAVGSLMVARSAPVTSLGDLKGRKIGVSGGPLDKSWLMLLAHARNAAGLDLTRDAEPVYAAPPLLAEKLVRGELDAALLFWNYAVKLEALGLETLLSVEDLQKALGASGPVAMVGYTFDRRLAETRPQTIAAFLTAARRAKSILQTSDADWEALKPLVRAENDTVFALLKKGYRDGIPSRSVAEEAADAAKLYRVMAAIGGERLIGRAPHLSEGTFFQQGSARD